MERGNKTADVMIGRGINRKIRRAYGYLASRYRPGDKIHLLAVAWCTGMRRLRGCLAQLGWCGLSLPRCAISARLSLSDGQRYRNPAAFAMPIATQRLRWKWRRMGHSGRWPLPLLWQWSEYVTPFMTTNWAPCEGRVSLALNETAMSTVCAVENDARLFRPA